MPRVATGARSVSPQPGPLRGTEPLTPRSVRMLLSVSFRHMDPALFLYIVGVSLLVAGFQLMIGQLFSSRLPVGDAVVLGTAVFVMSLICVPISTLWSLHRWRRQAWVVGYFDHTATQLVHPDDHGAWLLSDHHALRRGHGLAARFRRSVFHHLANEADRAHIDIVTNTRVPKLAQRYMADMPGLVIENNSRRDFIGRRLYDLRRHPSASRVDDKADSTKPDG